MFDILRNDQKLKKYLPIIENFEKYPVFYDQKRQVLSLPPIINSDNTKISMNTKNVFIEVTGTELTKCKIVLAILACQFSKHCQGQEQFTIEPVEVVYEDETLGTMVTPTLETSDFEVEAKYISRLLGIELTVDQMRAAGVRMGLIPLEASAADRLNFRVSPIRADILHACDIAEEIGIGYGFNNIEMTYPSSNTIGSYIPQNKFTDLLRHELA